MEYYFLGEEGVWRESRSELEILHFLDSQTAIPFDFGIIYIEDNSERILRIEFSFAAIPKVLRGVRSKIRI